MKRLAILGIVLLAESRFSSSQAQAQDFERALIPIRSAVVLVVVGEDTYSGFLIADDPPLVATAAHMAANVAKPEDVIVRANETGTIARVRAVHIHNGYKKERTNKDPYGPDAAILELDPASPELGLVLAISPPNTETDLRGIEIVSLGFPPYAAIPSELESPAAVFRRGVVQRMLDDNATTTTIMPPTRRPLLQHDLNCLLGESGSPIVSLSSGMVVGIQIGDRKWKTTAGVVFANPGIAVHADKLWEVAEQAGFTQALQQAGK